MAWFFMKMIIFCTIFIPLVFALGGSTDTITWGGDLSRAGYETNHNIDPAIVGGPNFGQLFKTQLPGNFNGIGAEQVYSQPLVFTGTDSIQHVYISTSQNNLYKLDSKTGAILASRNLGVPFLAADLETCNDIAPAIGITGTGTIDKDTGIWYFTLKTYSPQFQDGNFSPTNRPGRLNARYYFYGINTQSPTLEDAFPPVPLEGLLFRNNPNRMFLSGNQHSRPAVTLVGNFVYTGYASHCVQYNYTGAIIAHDKRNGAIVEAFAIEGGPEPNNVPGGGVWMSGGGIAYDGAGSLFFSTGNGYSTQISSSTPIPGRQPPTSLEEAVVNVKINDDGTLTPIDFFMPWEKVQLDGADKDLGTTPLEILPTSTFSCPNVKRMGVLTGKSGKTYVLNLDSLGGYQMGPNKLDAAVFVYQNENSVYSGAGVMPLAGGYIYINVIKYQTRVFKFGCDASGNPVFTIASLTNEFNAAALGTGHGTTTSLNGQEGTGLYWMTDVEGLNLRIYNAIPSSIGSPLQMIKSFNIPGMSKFARPVFGNGRVYIGTATGNVYGFGSPVQLPLNCTSPINFPQTQLNSTSVESTVTCSALIDTTLTGLGLVGNPNFILSNLPNTPMLVPRGQTFSFRAAFAPKLVGPLSSDVLVNSTNSVGGYAINTPIALRGTGESLLPILRIAPNTISFNSIVNDAPGGVNQSAVISNLGNGTLSISSFQFSTVSEKGPWASSTNGSDPVVSIGPFSFYNIPSIIPGNSAIAVPINYNPETTGNSAVYVKASSDGGSQLLDVFGVAGSYPRALIEFENFDGSGSWIKLDNTSRFSFGNVTEGQTKQLRLRVTNNGGPDAVPLSITVSKPPYGTTGIVGAVNNIDLAEGTIIPANQSASAVVFCSVPRSQVNLPSYAGSANWTMNTGDPTLGKQFMQFDCNAVTDQVGPVFPNGTAKFGYVGCFRENTPGRQMAKLLYNDGTGNTNNKCVSGCAADGWTFAATQYRQECWCGNAIPITKEPEIECNYACSGNDKQICGGNGYFGNKAELSLFADSTKFNGVTISRPLSIPKVVNGFTYQGCYAESGGKAMTALAKTDSRSMTVEMCAGYCVSFQYFSLEYAQECYCGSSINSAVATLTLDSDCSMSCKGNNSEYCGAGYRAQIYNRNPVTISSSSLTSSMTSTISTTSTQFTLTVSSSMTSPSPAAYTSLGCYTDPAGSRTLSAATVTKNDMSISRCSQFCSRYKYFGVEYGQECWCDNSIASTSSTAPTSECNMPCSGSPSEMCGAGYRINIYTQTPTGPRVPAQIGNYSSIGCYSDDVGSRALSFTFTSSTMSLEVCASKASTPGVNATYFGVEYGSECWWGDSIIGSSSLVSDQSSCNMVCPGNSNQLCGAGNRLTMFAYRPLVVIANASSSSSALMSSTTQFPSSSTASILITSSTIDFTNATNTSGSIPSSASIANLTLGQTSSTTSDGQLNLTSSDTWRPSTAASTTSTSATASSTLLSSSLSLSSQILATISTFNSSTSVTQLSITASLNTSSATIPITSAVISTSNTIIHSSNTMTTASFTSSANSTSLAGLISMSSSNISSFPYSSSSTHRSLSSITYNATSSSTFSNPGSPPAMSNSVSTSNSTSLFGTTATPTFSTTVLFSSSSSSASITTTLSFSFSTTSSVRSATTSTGPTAVPSFESYVHQGCYTEVSGRALNATSKFSDTMTVAQCALFCAPYAYFGVEYASQCFCGPVLRNGSLKAGTPGSGASVADCKMPCKGNLDNLCGGSSRLNLYYSTDPSKSRSWPSSPQRVGAFDYQGCVVDNPRMLGKMFGSDTMTLEECMDIADSYGYMWAGVEYARECWVGMALKAPVQFDEGCKMTCKGNVSEICGGSSRLSLYKRI